MAKKSKPDLADDPDLMMPKMAQDEIEELHSVDTASLPPPPPPAAPAYTAPPPPPPPAAPAYTAPPPPPPIPSVTVVDINNGMNNGMGQAAFMQSQITAQTQAQASVGLAQTNIDQEIFEKQSEKEDEHWAKAFWRPAMGWLYMIICFMDFVGFPLLTIFLPIIFKPFGLVMPYQAWTSLTLSNGGLIHLAFGAILGVSAFTRGQEKIAAAK